MPPRNIHPLSRRENRIPMEIPVVLDGHRHLPGTEATFTENVSLNGARVVSMGLEWQGRSDIQAAAACDLIRWPASPSTTSLCLMRRMLCTRANRRGSRRSSPHGQSD